MERTVALLGIDIHCHILPQIDDGPRSLEEALQMAQKCAMEGLGIAVATPHYIMDDPSCSIEEIAQQFDRLNHALTREVVTIKLLRGAEIMANPMVPGLNTDILKKLSINGSRYLLIEMPALDIPAYMDDLLYNLQLKGFIPIIAHPERNAAIIDDPPAAYELADQGALLQINAGSITGRFGRNVQKTALMLIKHRLGHFVATDAHSPGKRGPRMIESFDAIADIFGIQRAQQLWIDNPTAVISDDIINTEHPIPFRKRWFGGWR